jgi:Fe-S-cluster containining protein
MMVFAAYRESLKRIRRTYAALDAKNAELTRRWERENGRPVSCRKGCGECCKQWVGVSFLEALWCAIACEKTGYDLSARGLKSAADVARLPGMTRERWFGLGNPCIFLRSDKACGVHALRPIACRAVIVISNPSDCKSATGEVTRLQNRDAVHAAYRILQAEHAASSLLMVVAALPLMVELVFQDARPGDLQKDAGVWGLSE